MKRTKWLIYSVIIGLIPILIRIFIYLIDKTATSSYCINPTDFIAFVLVLNLTNINELEHKTFDDILWKTKKIGYSIILILLSSSFLAIITYSEFKKNPDLNMFTMKICCIVLTIVTFIFSLSIYNRLNSLEE
jgi:TRAP-type C4-dicarboxylate transport system permease large subunit